MIDLEEYLRELITECHLVFGDRLLYLGLQGSYLRGEATENSDIDIMVILDRFSVADMDAYRDILQRIGYYDKSCGFICGREEMACWNPLELCHLKHATRDLYGNLSDYLPDASRDDEINFVKLSLGNLYHELCHRYIHADWEKNAERFRQSCKGLFFLIQNLFYLESAVFAGTRAELKELVPKADRRVLAMWELPEEYDFPKAFSEVFLWCQDAFRRVEKLR